MEQVVTNATFLSTTEQVATNATFSSTTESVTAMKAAGAAVLYTVGIFGNLLALFILHRTRSSSNQKHGFMLRCLATNDCIALAGQMVMSIVTMYWPQTRTSKLSCQFRVLWRFFGLGSGCVATIMAVERWLALTKPFLYQKVSVPRSLCKPLLV